MTILSLSADAQDAYQKCYDLTTATHCFKTDRNELLKPFDEASGWCESQGYFLARIVNPDIQIMVEQFLSEFELISDDVWIGAKRRTQGQWKWVNGDVYDDGDSLPTADRNDTDAGVAYLEVNPASSEFTLAADSYSTRQHYICKFTGSTCNRYAGSEGFYDAGSGTCYVTFPQYNERAKTLWFLARNKCLKEGGDLAGEAAINLSLPLKQNEKYLVGLRRGEFVWTDQSATPLNWTRFLSSEPSSLNTKNCVSLSYISHWGWSTRDCTESVLFVCQKVEPRSDPCPTVDPTGTPSTTDGESGECWTDDTNLLIGVIVGCVLFYIISILLVIIIMACCCRTRESSGGPRQAPIVAYHNDNDYLEPAPSHNVYNDVRNTK